MQELQAGQSHLQIFLETLLKHTNMEVIGGS